MKISLLFVFLFVFSKTVFSSESFFINKLANLPAESDITHLINQNPQQVLELLWENQEIEYPVFTLGEVEDLTDDQLVQVYVLIKQGKLLSYSSFYQNKLFDLAYAGILSQSAVTKLYLNLPKQEVRALLPYKMRDFQVIDSIINDNSLLTAQEIREIVSFNPDLSEFSNGEYDNSLTTFVFCRQNRDYPCRIMIKDKRGDWVKDTDGSIFNLPVLAKSSRGIASHLTNGNTPRGVHTLDSVMPFADQFNSFGAYRRVKMHFVPAVLNDENSLIFFPPSQHNKLWWKRASLARDNGRSLLRIHGTGRPNYNQSLAWYPLRPTAGCIMTREGDYGDVKYIDQRHVLDSMMRALDLGETYANESLIKGRLYLIEIDNKNSSVELADLLALDLI